MTHCDASLWPQVIVEEVMLYWHTDIFAQMVKNWLLLFVIHLTLRNITAVPGCGSYNVRERKVWRVSDTGLYFFSHTSSVCLCAFIMIFFPVKDSSISALSPDAIMTLTSMMNGAVYIFPSIRTNQGHFAFLFLHSRQQYMFSVIC